MNTGKLEKRIKNIEQELRKYRNQRDTLSSRNKTSGVDITCIVSGTSYVEAYTPGFIVSTGSSGAGKYPQFVPGHYPSYYAGNGVYQQNHENRPSSFQTVGVGVVQHGYDGSKQGIVTVRIAGTTIVRIEEYDYTRDSSDKYTIAFNTLLTIGEEKAVTVKESSRVYQPFLVALEKPAYGNTYLYAKFGNYERRSFIVRPTGTFPNAPSGYDDVKTFIGDVYSYGTLLEEDVPIRVPSLAPYSDIIFDIDYIALREVENPVKDGNGDTLVNNAGDTVYGFVYLITHGGSFI